MRHLSRFASIYSALLAATAFAAPAASGNLSPDRKAACAALCDRADNASCKNARSIADCVKTCDTFVAQVPSPCLKTWDAWMKLKSDAAWKCDDQDFPKPGGNAINSPEFWECVGDQKPAPKFPLCAMSSTRPYCTSCMMSECSEQALACGKSADCKAEEQCLTSCDSRADDAPKIACIAKCKSKHTAGHPLFQRLNDCVMGGTCESSCYGGFSNTFGYTDTDDKHKTIGVFTECSGMFP